MSSLLSYTALDGSAAQGVVWSPGPLPKTVWVLPESGSPASDAVVVRLDGGPVGLHKQVTWDFQKEVLRRHGSIANNPSYHEITRQTTLIALSNAPALPTKLWKAATADVTTGYDLESSQSAGD
jgi:hypothetical protein